MLKVVSIFSDTKSGSSQCCLYNTSQMSLPHTLDCFYNMTSQIFQSRRLSSINLNIFIPPMLHLKLLFLQFVCLLGPPKHEFEMFLDTYCRSLKNPKFFLTQDLILFLLNMRLFVKRLLFNKTIFEMKLWFLWAAISEGTSLLIEHKHWVLFWHSFLINSLSIYSFREYL